MKYLIGALVGVGFLWAGFAVASGGFTLVGASYGVWKYYDQDNNVVCYSVTQGISCLKNI
jgi:hypothetical protein